MVGRRWLPLELAAVKNRITTVISPEIPVKWKVNKTFVFGFAKSTLHGILTYSILCWYT